MTISRRAQRQPVGRKTQKTNMHNKQEETATPTTMAGASNETVVVAEEPDLENEGSEESDQDGGSNLFADQETENEPVPTAGDVGCWKFLLPLRCHYRGHEVVDATLVRSYEAHIEGECDACGCAMEPPDEDTYVVVKGVTTQRFVWLCQKCWYEHASWETTPEPWMLVGTTIAPIPAEGAEGGAS